MEFSAYCYYANVYMNNIHMILKRGHIGMEFLASCY